MPLAADAHREHVVGEPGGLGPGGGQGDVTANAFGVLEGLEPAEAVRVGPDRVVDAREVGVEATASLVEEVGEQDRHLVVGEGVLDRPVELVPLLDRLAALGGSRGELVPAVSAGAAGGADRAGQHVDEEQTPGHLPPTEVAGSGRAPVVRGELRRMTSDDLGDLAEGVTGDPADVLGPFGGVLGVLVEQRLLEALELAGQVGASLLEVGLPVDPATHEVALPGAVGDEETRDRQHHERLGARPRREPVVGLGPGVGEPRVDADDRRAPRLALHDPLRVGVEVVAGFEVGGDQEDDLGVREVRGRAVEAHPGLVADAGVR